MPRPSRAARSPSPPPEDEYLKLENQLCFPLYAASRLMVNAYRPLLAELGITYPQYLVLLVLWEKDGLSVGAIGELLLLDSGTLTPVLKRLVGQGVIERRRNAGDDRVVENWLTPRGKAMKKDAVRIPVELICRAGIEMGELARMRAMLGGLIVSLQRIQELPPPPSADE